MTRVPPAFAIKSATKARQVLLRAADRLVPSEIALLDHSVAFTRPHLLAAVVEFGIPDQLADGPKNAEQLAGASGADADSLHRVLRAAATFGFVRLDKAGRFHNTRLTRALRADARFQTAEWCRYTASASVQQAWGGLSETVKSGESAFGRVHGMGMFEWFEAHPAEERAFSRGLAGLTLMEAPAIVAAYPFPDDGVICDVAGGTGALLGEVLNARPRVKAILVEAPSVLDEARSYLSDIGVSERVEFLPGDFMTRGEAVADLYILKWILHDWSDEICRRILAAVKATMKPGSRLLIVEGEQDLHQVSPRFGPLDVHMMTVCDGGRERSLGEFHALLDSVGLFAGDVVRTATGLLLVEGLASQRA